MGDEAFRVSLSTTIENLPSLQPIPIGQAALRESSLTIIENLPSLQSITLGEAALEGSYNDSCLLTMRNLPNLTSINSEGGSFNYTRSVTLENIPNLQFVKLPDSFRFVQSKSISNVSSILADLVKINPDPNPFGLSAPRIWW